MKLVAALMFVPSLALAGQCVFYNKTGTLSRLPEIQERAEIRHFVTPEINGVRKCVVSFRARIGHEWYTAHGDSVFVGNQNSQQVCATAYQRAEQNVRNTVSPDQISSESVMVCSDRSDHELVRRTHVGTMARLSQFRPHPDRPREFHHNGTQCRWFLDTEFRHTDVATFQGVICHVQNQMWVVVDKF